jgi:predicted Na+-dependent transporter
MGKGGVLNRIILKKDIPIVSFFIITSILFIVLAFVNEKVKSIHQTDLMILFFSAIFILMVILLLLFFLIKELILRMPGKEERG